MASLIRLRAFDCKISTNIKQVKLRYIGEIPNQDRCFFTMMCKPRYSHGNSSELNILT